MTAKDTGRLAPGKLRRWLNRAAEPAILFSTLAILVLGVVWGTTLNLIHVERRAAERAAALSSYELAETYEAQVVRALREIDQTLKLVKYAYELKGSHVVLQDLKAKSLLPPALLFVVGIANSHGDVVASTRHSAMANVADQDYFQAPRSIDALSIGRPPRGPNAGAGELQFSRRLETADGAFAGIVMVSVDAAYFVSGFETSRMGEHGVLGILGDDGVFLARRTGDEAVSAGDAVDFAATVPGESAESVSGALSVNAWDGVRRFTRARRLHEFPLAVIAGLSADEQLAVVRRDMQTYLWRASSGSILLILTVAILGRLSRQLAQSRQRVVEEQIAHAARIEYLAYHDGLTALPNRSLFSKLLGQGISQAQRHDKHLAVLFLDLDQFKKINDTLGHDAGDQLLREVATRLKTCLRDGDTVARLGGDEFVVLLPKLDEEYVATVARKILSALAQPYVLVGHSLRVTASVGISTYPQDGLDEQTLTKNADIAMYRAKGKGRNNFQFYSEKLNAQRAQANIADSDVLAPA